MRITSQRVLNSDEVQDMCIKYNYYTNGDCQGYENLRDFVNKLKNVCDNDVFMIAADIIKHSAELDFEKELTFVMFNVGSLIHTFYTIED
ncbi:MAG: hypothetical protein RR338_01155 [Clostridia bacterium]